MDISLIFLICGCAALLLTLLTCFFGYKLGRFLLPLTGLIVLEGMLYIYLYPLLSLNTLSTWLFFGGSFIVFYLLLFLFSRVAGFFTGFAGSAIIIIFAVYAFNLHNIILLYPIALTVCVTAGLLTAVYKRVGVIVATSLLGGCASAYIGSILYLQGIDASTALYSGNILIPLEAFLINHVLLIGGIGLGLTVAGILVQLLLTGRKQVLSNRSDEKSSFKLKRKPKTNKKADALA